MADKASNAQEPAAAVASLEETKLEVQHGEVLDNARTDAGKDTTGDVEVLDNARTDVDTAAEGAEEAAEAEAAAEVTGETQEEAAAAGAPEVAE